LEKQAPKQPELQPSERDEKPSAVVEDYRPDAGPEVDDLEDLVESGDVEALDSFLALLHPADLAELFEILDRDLWPKVLIRLDIARTSDLMEELPDDLRDDLAEHLKRDQLTKVIEEMASDDAADVLADLPGALAKDLIKSLPREDRQEVETLLRYPDDTAGGLMQMELVSVPVTATVDQAVEAVRANAEDVGDFHFVYVVDSYGRLVGQLGLEQLILAQPPTLIRELMSHDIHAVTPELDQEDVGRMVSRYNLVAVPVIDAQGKLLGRIQHDDVLDVLEEEANEDILHMAGANPNEPELVYTDQLLKIASVRLPWLLATLVGLTIPALLVWAFQLSFPHMLALIPFIPVIGAMGGNVGTQSSTIVVRGFATGRVDFHNLGRFLAKELVISVIMGLACGVVAGVVAVIWHGNFMLCVTVSVSMVAAIITSAIMGVLIPFLFKATKIDPAIAAGPAVTTIDDILAIVIYYVFALLLIPAT
jgi:magnesium transporter